MTRQPDLTPDCAACASLCCVVFAFDRSESFAIDKAAGEVCPNLESNGTCRIFSERETRGFRGCITYDCHGAGQVVTQEVFKGTSWRDDPSLTRRMGAALSVLRRIHEQLLLLKMAAELPLSDAERARHRALTGKLAADPAWTEASLQAFPLDETVREVAAFLGGLRRHVSRNASARR